MYIRKQTYSQFVCVGVKSRILKNVTVWITLSASYFFKFYTVSNLGPMVNSGMRPTINKRYTKTEGKVLHNGGLLCCHTYSIINRDHRLGWLQLMCDCQLLYNYFASCLAFHHFMCSAQAMNAYVTPQAVVMMDPIWHCLIIRSTVAHHQIMKKDAKKNKPWGILAPGFDKYGYVCSQWND